MWQHSQCLGISQQEAEREEFHFICRDCKRREEEAKLPKLPPLKFRIGQSSSPSAAGVSNGHQDAPPMKQNPTAISNLQRPAAGQPAPQPSLPNTAQFYAQPRPSPERRPPAGQGHFASSPPRAPFSPSKSINGLTPSSKEYQTKVMSNQQYPLPPIQQATHLRPQVGSFDAGSFSTQRPPSSHSTQNPNLPSPIKNRPSMSPTQGNHDVGPLAGFPLPPPNGSAPFTPSGQHYARPTTAGHDFTPSMHRGNLSFSAATPASHSSPPPQSSHGVHMSGISPVKHSSRPLTSGGMTGAPVLPPIQALEPSPKLMGRSSPDAPVPSPMKSMTPEESKHRENT